MRSRSMAGHTDKSRIGWPYSHIIPVTDYTSYTSTLVSLVLLPASFLIVTPLGSTLSPAPSVPRPRTTMGGNTFEKENPAARLTSDQLLKLSTLVQSRIAHHFGRMQHLYFLHSKTSHGDLDLLCAWDAPAWALEGKATEEDKEAFASQLAHDVGAVMWKTSGCRVGSLEVHLAVPIEVLDDALVGSEVYLVTE